MSGIFFHGQICKVVDVQLKSMIASIVCINVVSIFFKDSEPHIKPKIDLKIVQIYYFINFECKLQKLTHFGLDSFCRTLR